MTFDRFCEIVRTEYAAIPPRLLEGLDGGVHCEQAALPDPDDPRIFQMGFYEPGWTCGPRIVLHYGSFLEVGLRPVEYRHEIRETLRHELRHHWEDRAGLPDLRAEDAAWLTENRRSRTARSTAEEWTALQSLLGVTVCVAIGSAAFLVVPGPAAGRAAIAALVAVLAYRFLGPPGQDAPPRKRRRTRRDLPARPSRKQRPRPPPPEDGPPGS